MSQLPQQFRPPQFLIYEGTNYDVHDLDRSSRVYEGFSACERRAEECEHKSVFTPTALGTTHQLVDVR